VSSSAQPIRALPSARLARWCSQRTPQQPFLGLGEAGVNWGRNGRASLSTGVCPAHGCCSAAGAVSFESSRLGALQHPLGIAPSGGWSSRLPRRRVLSSAPPRLAARLRHAARPGIDQRRVSPSRFRSSGRRWRQGGMSTSSIKARYAAGLRQCGCLAGAQMLPRPPLGGAAPAKADQERDCRGTARYGPSWALRSARAEGVAVNHAPKRRLSQAGAAGPGKPQPTPRSAGVGHQIR